MNKKVDDVKKIFLQSSFAHDQNIKKIGESDDIFDMGMDSLSFVSLIVAIEKKFDITFNIDDLSYKNLNTLKKITDACEKAKSYKSDL